MSFWALIPAYNEADRIADTVAAVSTVDDVAGILVVDDGSTDGTSDRATAAGARVLTLARNHGKGAALDRGVKWIAENVGQSDIVLLDGDLGVTAAEAALLTSPVARGEADMTIARFPRPPHGTAGFGLVKGLARWGIRTLGSARFDAQAPLSGQRALNSAAVAACTPFAQGYGVEVALTVRALRAGLRVMEIETSMAHAATGRDVAGFAHRGKQFLHVARTLASLTLRRAR